ERSSVMVIYSWQLLPWFSDQPVSSRSAFRSRRSDLARLAWLARLNCGQAEPHVGVPDDRRVPVAVRRAAVPAPVAPAPAAAHPVRGPLSKLRIRPTNE